MVLIKSGLCTVGKVTTASRKFDIVETQGLRKVLKDSNPLFNNFDPENSLFNLTKSHNKAVQNVRVFVNDQGEQVKDEVLYENIVSFSQTFHWVFGSWAFRRWSVKTGSAGES